MSQRRSPAVVALVLVASYGLQSCGSSGSAPAPVAMVDGKAVSAALFERFAEKKAGQPGGKLDAGLRGRLREDLIALESAAAAGSRLNPPGAEQDAELARLEVFARAAAVAAHVYDAPSDADLEEAYRTYVASLPGREFHVAHILVATEALAFGTIRELDAGKDFAAAAKVRSADDSSVNGGDLGWVAPGHLPTEFTDAVAALKPGQYTRRPLKTIYGWHVIRLIELRPASAPEFNAVKAQIAGNLQQERYAQFLKSVVAKTSIERPLADGSPR